MNSLGWILVSWGLLGWIFWSHSLDPTPCADGDIFTYVECVRTVLDTWQDGAEVETKDEVSSLLQRLSDHDACDI